MLCREKIIFGSSPRIHGETQIFLNTHESDFIRLEITFHKIGSGLGPKLEFQNQAHHGYCRCRICLTSEYLPVWLTATRWSRVESRRSLSVKADDPKKDQSRRSWSKADDPWAKADDPSKSRRSFVKADDLWVKPDDPERKRTISRLKADDLIWKCEKMKPDDLGHESRRSS